MNIQDGAERNVIVFFSLLALHFHNMCAVEPSDDYYAPQLCMQTAARQFEASFHVGRTNWTPQTS